MKKIILKKRGVYSYWQENKFNIGKTESKIEKRGGGAFLFNKKNVKIKNKVFILNGFTKDGGAIYLNSCSDILIKGCTFILNIAKWGGALYIEKSENISVVENFFVFNFAVRDGSAISISFSKDIYLVNNRFLCNFSFQKNQTTVDIYKSSNIFNDNELINSWK